MSIEHTSEPHSHEACTAQFVDAMASTAAGQVAFNCRGRISRGLCLLRTWRPCGLQLRNEARYEEVSRMARFQEAQKRMKTSMSMPEWRDNKQLHPSVLPDP